MRTTVTLVPDVAALVERDMRDRGVPFKRALNDAIRAGLASRKKRNRYVVAARPMGKPSFPLTNALQIAADLEDDEMARKLPLGK
jgi:hypothetical protein